MHLDHIESRGVEMHCIKCGTEIPEGGSFCPKCGTASPQSASPATPQSPTPAPDTLAVPDAKPKSGPGCLKIGLGIVAGLIVLGVIGNLLPKPPEDKTKPTSNEAASPTATEEQGEIPVAVTANELFNAYQSNEASAQGYFGNRKLLVTGTVDKVALDLFDNPEILLRTSNQFMSAHADLADEAKDSAGDYGPGDKVRLLCDGVREVASIPMLKDCRKAPDGLKGEPVQWKK